MRRMFAVLGLLLVAAVPGHAQSPNGEVVYKQHCAACHDGTLPRMPSREALRGFTPESVETALGSLTMRRQGAGLSPSARRAVAEYVTGRPAGSYRAPLEIIPSSAYCGASASGDPLAGSSWNGWGGDLHNSRFQATAAAGLGASDVPRLRWQCPRYVFIGTMRFRKLPSSPAAL